jgi:hypothetical protein
MFFQGFTGLALALTGIMIGLNFQVFEAPAAGPVLAAAVAILYLKDAVMNIGAAALEYVRRKDD